MDNNFQSGDNVFVLYGLAPRLSSKGESNINIILDVPHTEDLYNTLNHFLWKDVKLNVEKSTGGNAVQSEFYISNVQAKDYKEGPRIRVTVRQPFNQAIFLKLGKLLFNDVKLEMEIQQKELEFEPPDIEGEVGE